MKRVEWQRVTAGWALYVDRIFAGHVWRDGSFTHVKGVHGCRGSQPLAAQALLRAAGVEP